MDVAREGDVRARPDGSPSDRKPSLRLPTFMIIGAMKASTTSLFDRLGTHPDVGTSRIKEPDFFIAEKNFSKGLGWYESLFAGTEGAVARGEASTSYSKCGQFPGVPARIHAVVPDVRLIYLLRDPVERIRSMYQHGALSGRERRPANKAVLTDPMYVEVSSYARQIDAYLEVFRPGQLHVLTMDDLRDRPEDTLRTLCAHIGVDWYLPLRSENPRKNVSEGRRADTATSLALRNSDLFRRLVRRTPKRVTDLGKRIVTRKASIDATLSPETVAELRERLRPDMERLEELTGRSFAHWRDGTQ